MKRGFFGGILLAAAMGVAAAAPMGSSSQVFSIPHVEGAPERQRKSAPRPSAPRRIRSRWKAARRKLRPNMRLVSRRVRRKHRKARRAA